MATTRGAATFVPTELRMIMLAAEQNDPLRFFIAGINYKKTEASIRGQFAIDKDQYAEILSLAKSQGLGELFILSTCNRTEIYGFADNPCQLIELLCSKTAGNKETFLQLCYVKQGEEAVQHFFEVGAGLESQILGDYEIIGQIKLAFKFSKEHGCIGAFTERLVNCVLQSTKVIKNQTALSGGTVSVSFAAVQYLKKNVTAIATKKILLIGVGKIGRNTCKNLIDYLKTCDITLINRSTKKAIELAQELGVKYATFDNLPQEVASADIVLVATNSNQAIIKKEHLLYNGDKVVIDLSIPYNVAKDAQDLPNITLINVDDLSKLKDETLQKRMGEIPKAREIISVYKSEFLEWSEMRKNVPYIRAVKQKLHDMHNCDLYLSSYQPPGFITGTSSAALVNKVAIEKVIKNMAVKMRQQQRPGCCYIQAINDFITTHSN